MKVVGDMNTDQKVNEIKNTTEQNQSNRRKKVDVEIIILAAILILFSIIVGINRIKTSDFNPINGDFQNYNPVRRLLAGQVPFKDFAVYLGSGHLFLLSFFQLLVGNTFTKSLFVTNMLTFACFEILVYVIGFLVLKDKKKALYLTIFMAILNILRPTILSYILSAQFIQGFDIGLAPGGSARLIRIFAAPLSVGIIYIANYYLQKSSKPLIKNNICLLKKISMAFIAGFTVLWSNDGGIATYISISFIYFLLLIKEYKKDLKKIIAYVLMYIAISCSTFFILVTLITRGYPFSWFTYTFGVSSYQKWYYLFGVTKENISLLQIDLSFSKALMVIITIFNIVKLFKTKDNKETLFYALLSILSFSIILSSYLYQFLSGGLLNEIVSLFLIIIIAAYLMRFIVKNTKSVNIFKSSKVVILVASLALIIANTNSILKFSRTRHTTTNYVAKLGGYINDDWDIEDTLNKVGNDSVFAVYASAINTATNTFQPTGIDYIIHVLGDKQREEYLQIFNRGNFRYVEDISQNNSWYSWIRNANWFFYRELYKNYKIAFNGDYSNFFVKKNEDEVYDGLDDLDNVSISIEKKNDYKYVIKIKNGGKVQDGIVDLKIAYSSNFKSFFKNFDINRYVTVFDPNLSNTYGELLSSFNIPNTSNEYYIPVLLTNGEGIIEISSYPFDNTELFLDRAEIINIYDYFKYIQATSQKVDYDNENMLYIDNTYQNRLYLKNATKIKQNKNNVMADILDYEERGSFIILKIDKNANDFIYPYYFEVIEKDNIDDN